MRVRNLQKTSLKSSRVERVYFAPKLRVRATKYARLCSHGTVRPTPKCQRKQKFDINVTCMPSVCPHLLSLSLSLCPRGNSTCCSNNNAELGLKIPWSPRHQAPSLTFFSYPLYQSDCFFSWVDLIDGPLFISKSKKEDGREP